LASRPVHCYAARSPAPGSALPAGRRVRTIIYLIDTMACDTQGTQKQLLETIRRLDRAAWSPHLVCLWESPWMRTAQRCRARCTSWATPAS
jgi:hypothetical protein